MAWNIQMVGNAASIVAQLPALVVSTGNAGEVAEVAAVKSLLVARLPASGSVIVRASGTATAVDNFHINLSVLPVTLIA